MERYNENNGPNVKVRALEILRRAEEAYIYLGLVGPLCIGVWDVGLCTNHQPTPKAGISPLFVNKNVLCSRGEFFETSPAILLADRK
jgi:hypothetical protein